MWENKLRQNILCMLLILKAVYMDLDIFENHHRSMNLSLNSLIIFCWFGLAHIPKQKII